MGSLGIMRSLPVLSAIFFTVSLKIRDLFAFTLVELFSVEII